MLGFGSKSGRTLARKRLGELLVEEGLLQPDDLKKALAQQRRDGGLLGKILVQSGMIEQNVLLASLRRINSLATVSLIDYNINQQSIQQIPEDLCRAHCLLPIDKLGRILTVAIVDPLDTQALEEVDRCCPDLRVKPLPCSWDDFAVVFKRIFKSEVEKPADLDSRYDYLDMDALTTSAMEGAGKSQPAPSAKVRDQAKAEADDFELAGNGERDASDEELFGTPDIEDIIEEGLSGTSRVFRRGAGPTVSALSSLDFAAGIQELAASVQEGIKEAMRELTATASINSNNQVDAKLLMEAVQEALEGAVASFAHELQQERNAIKEHFDLVQSQIIEETESNVSTLANEITERQNTSIQEILNALSTQLSSVGTAIQELGPAKTQEASVPEMMEALQRAVTEATRESASSMAETLRQLLSQQAEGFSVRTPDPLEIAAIIRVGIGEVMSKALEGMSVQMEKLAETQQEYMAALPPPPDFQAAAHMLQEHLSAGLDARLGLLSEQLKVLLEQGQTAGNKNIEELARVFQESVMIAITANEKAQMEQHGQLNDLVERSLSAMTAEKEAQQEELVQVAQAILSSVEQGRASQMEQQEHLAHLTQAFSAMTMEKGAQKKDLEHFAEAILGAAEQGRIYQQEQQSQLSQLTQMLASNAEGKGEHYDELARVAGSILSTVEQSLDYQMAQQNHITQMTQALSALAEDRIAQKNELEHFAEAMMSAVEQGRSFHSEQQNHITQLTQALSSMVMEKDSQKNDLEQVARAVLAAVEQGKASQAALHGQLAQLTESLSSVAVEKGTQASDLGRVAEAILAAIEHEKASQSDKHGELAQIAQAALESVKQTSQLIEAHTVAESTRNDLIRRRQSLHASVTAFNPEGTVNPEDYAEEDKRVREGLDTEQPMSKLTFDTFFAGDSNTFTVSLARTVAESPGSEYNPLFLYGPVGLGKTHLLSAIGNEMLARFAGTKKRPPIRVGYVSASHFSRRLAAAVADNALELFRDNYCKWDALLLDDIQFLGGRVEAQEEFFHIFNVLHQAGRQLVIAGDRPPDKLGLLEQRLVSRFASGIVAEVKAPEWETRMKILRHIAEDGKHKVSDDLLSLIALRVSGDIRKMIGAFRKIIAYSRVRGDKISMEEAQSILGHLDGENSA
jgi:chromosomal replication initiator protein DnaA